MTDVTDLETLRCAAVEQVMRLCSDEALVAGVAAAEPATPAAKAAVGRVLFSAATVLAGGDPLLVFAAGLGGVDPRWRERCNPGEDSLWAEWEFCVRLGDGEAAAAADPYLQLLEMRAAISAEFAA